MNVGSLFSGIGGLDHGLHRAGWEHAFFCESDPWRRDVLRAHWPGVPIYDDVRDVDAGHLQPDGQSGEPATEGHERDVRGRLACDLLCGGFPCQDLSVAGQRRGLAGSRSGLFFEFARIIDLVRPRFVLLENVPGLLSSNGGRDFGVVLGTLADVGYGVGWRTLDSRFFGVPQRRRRVFIVAARADGDPSGAARRAGEILAVGTRCSGHSEAGGEAGPEPAFASLSGLGNGGPDDNDGQAGRLVAPALVKRYAKGADSDATDAMVVAGTLREHPRPGSNSDGAMVAAPLTSGGHPNSNMPGRRKEDDVNLVGLGWNWQTGGDFQPMFGEQAPALQKNQTTAVGVRRLTPTECERLQALPDHWTDYGPDSRRYSALGDAVTASVAEWLGRRLAAAL